MTSRYKIGLQILEQSQKTTRELQKKIKEEEPKLQDLGFMLQKKNETLKKMIENAGIKKIEMENAKLQLNKKVEFLTKLNLEIENEKSETEVEKKDALKFAEKLNVKDITEVSS